MLSNSKKSWKVLLLTLVAVLTVSVLAACGSDDSKKSSSSSDTKTESPASKDTSKVVATYQGGQVTENEFNLELSTIKFLYPQYADVAALDDFREYLVKQEIATKILAAKATDDQKKKAAESSEKQISQLKQSVGDEQFKKLLGEQKLTEDNVKSYLTRVNTVNETEAAAVTDDQMKKEFETNKDQFTTASVRHVLINFTDPKTNKERTKEETLKKAKEIKAKLDKGEDFAAIAKKYSEDPGSAEDGGLYKDAPVANWVDAFKEAAKTLPLNKISDPIETEYGYHIIRVESRTVADYSKLTDEQKTSLRNSVANTEVQNFIEKDLPGMITKLDLPKAPAASTDKGTGTTGTEGTTGSEGTSTDSSKTDSSKTDSTKDTTSSESGTTGK
ncbi:peptidylprolyl isomerase [Paenibacillus sp. JX-17]|uniref:Peptidylprolyl isomerase n=1 Tax=Paenibacillus lacisoli TaxID=3064525 RepID=A0ABT9CI78_9BACL|nr:peptidylprolyl isomerase [Paenibacillus sp. JX-17]MDO7908575.1 peptidylprolyl isomerase [Paenibacillus sp. JX-17]